MTGEQRADLERIAFGRTQTREDEDAAAAARQELAEADRTAEVAAVRAEVASARAASWELAASRTPEAGGWSLASTAPDGELPPPPPPEAPRRAARRIHTAWLVPIVAGAIAAGYFGATIAVAGVPQPTVDPAPSPSGKSAIVHLLPTPEPPSDVVIGVPESGNLKEADAWFEDPPREVDGFVNQEMMQHLELDPAAIRFVQTNAAGYQVWVAKKLNGDLCVLGTADSESASSSCIARDGFAQMGARMAAGGYTITWNGSAVTVTNPRSQIAP